MDREEINQDDIDQAAADWVIRLGATGPDKKTQRAFYQWLQQSEAHQQAFVEAQQLWLAMGQLREDPGSIAPFELPKAASRKRRQWLSAAAGVMALLLMSQFWLGATLTAMTADYATAPGEQKQVILPDGSEVHLAPDSAINVEYSQHQRRVHLLKGAAYFTVAAEKQAIFRPFIADAELLEGKALGTEFVIDRLDDHRIELGVTEHTVAVTSPSSPFETRVQEGYLLQLHEDGPGEPIAVGTQRMAAWRRNRLIFDRTPLAEALLHINRFRRNNIVIGRESLYALEISGTFDTNDTDQILFAIAQEFDMKYYTLPSFVTVLY